MKKNNVPQAHVRRCELITKNRRDDLHGYGRNAARHAIDNGCSYKDHRGYSFLVGDNNKEAWKTGWDAEWKSYLSTAENE